MIDGTIARKTGAVSQFGARLDTVSDFVFMLVCSIKILPVLHIPVWLWVWIIIVATICAFATVAAIQEVYFSAKGQDVL